MLLPKAKKKIIMNIEKTQNNYNNNFLIVLFNQTYIPWELAYLILITNVISSVVTLLENRLGHQKRSTAYCNNDTNDPQEHVVCEHPVDVQGKNASDTTEEVFIESFATNSDDTQFNFHPVTLQAIFNTFNQSSAGRNKNAEFVAEQYFPNVILMQHSIETYDIGGFTQQEGEIKTFYEIIYEFHKRIKSFVMQKQKLLHANVRLSSLPLNPGSSFDQFQCPCTDCITETQEHSSANKNLLKLQTDRKKLLQQALIKICEHCRDAEDTSAGLSPFLQYFNALLQESRMTKPFFFGDTIEIPTPGTHDTTIDSVSSASTEHSPSSKKQVFCTTQSCHGGHKQLNILKHWASGDCKENDIASNLTFLSFEDVLVFGALRTSQHASRVFLSRRPPENLASWLHTILTPDVPAVTLSEVIHQIGSSEWRLGIIFDPHSEGLRKLKHRSQFYSGFSTATREPSETSSTFKTTLSIPLSPELIIYPLVLSKEICNYVHQNKTMLIYLTSSLRRTCICEGSLIPKTPKRLTQKREKEHKQQALTNSARRAVQAVQRGDIQTIEQLLKLGLVPVDQRDWENANRVQLIHIAATLCQKQSKYRTLGGVKPLYELNETLHFNEDTVRDNANMTPNTCRGTQMLEILVSYGASIFAKDAEALLPLFYAAYSGCLTCTEYLLKKGTPIDSKDHQGRTPLYWAACGGKADATRYLLEQGADIHATSSIKRTAISKAAWADMAEVVKVLLDYGADPLVLDGKGRTPLHTSVWGSLGGRKGHKIVGGTMSSESLQCMTLLLNHPKGCEALKIPDNDGAFPLHIAASTGASTCIHKLIEAGAYVDIRVNKDAATPLMCAAYRGFMSCVHALVDHKANLSVCDGSGYDAICYAIQGGHTAVVKYLLERSCASFLKRRFPCLLNLCCLSLQDHCLSVLLMYLHKNDFFDHLHSNNLLPALLYSTLQGNVSAISDAVSLRWPPFSIGQCLKAPNTDFKQDQSNFDISLKHTLLNHNMIACQRILLADQNLSGSLSQNLVDIFSETLTLTLDQHAELKQLVLSHLDTLIERQAETLPFFLMSSAHMNSTQLLTHLLLNYHFNVVSDLTQALNQMCFKLKKNSNETQRQHETLISLLNAGANPIEASDAMISIAASGSVDMIYVLLNSCLKILENTPMQGALFNTIIHKALNTALEYGNFDVFLILSETKHKLKDLKDPLILPNEQDGNQNANFEKNETWNDVQTKFGYDLWEILDVTDIGNITEHPYIDAINLITSNTLKKLSECLNAKLPRKFATINNSFYDDNNVLFELLLKEKMAGIKTMAHLKREDVIMVSSSEVLKQVIDQFEALYTMQENYLFLGVDVECCAVRTDNVKICQSQDDDTLTKLHTNHNDNIDIVCLIQLSDGVTSTVVIDTLAISQKDITEQLTRIFSNSNIIKVMHGAANDLMWLATNFDLYVVNLLDTYRAAVLITTWLGHYTYGSRELKTIKKCLETVLNPLFTTKQDEKSHHALITQIIHEFSNQYTQQPYSLKELAKTYLNFSMTKFFQKANWRLRPLPLPMLLYAATDAFVLPDLCNHILRDLSILAMMEKTFFQNHFDNLSIVCKWIEISNASTLRPSKISARHHAYTVRSGRRND